MDTGVIYKITNIQNKKLYIGQAVNYTTDGRKWGSKRRWKSHIYRAKSNKCECRLLENAIRKYGEDSFIIEDIQDCKITELNYYENKYVEEFNSISPNGYNLMEGGGNGRRHHITTRNKMSKTRTGKKHSKETKDLISKAHKNKIVSCETRIKTSESSKRRNMNKENEKILQKALDNLNIKDLPMYICFSLERERKTEKISVRIPNRPRKTFSSKKLSLEEKIKMAINYKNSLT